MVKRNCAFCHNLFEIGKKKKFCSIGCQIQFYNKQSRPVYGIDKWGRKYLACGKCKKRLKKVEYIGRVKFICSGCFDARKHTPLQSSGFMKRYLKEAKKKGK